MGYPSQLGKASQAADSKDFTGRSIDIEKGWPQLKRDFFGVNMAPTGVDVSRGARREVPDHSTL
ncbi:hypothetical protein LVJ94_17040 [Pendulispora rubella]|uniref:Uncharacterized protein n=1 Tax=Pendulispora rubella TaxID=2741070 RepID=A0ABZ2LDF9_9BACT